MSFATQNKNPERVVGATLESVQRHLSARDVAWSVCDFSAKTKTKEKENGAVQVHQQQPTRGGDKDNQS